MSERNRILFVGYTCLDLVYVCKRYPLEDTKSRSLSNEWRRGGNAANNCSVFTQLLKWKSMTDFEVEYFGSMADDLAAKYLENDFQENGIIIENVIKQKESQCPSTCVIINEENGSRTCVHFNKNLSYLKSQMFSTLCLDKYKVIHFEGLPNVNEIIKMIKYIREKDIKREIKISVELERGYNQFKDLLSEDIDIFFAERVFAKLFDYQNSEQTVKGIAQLVHSKAVVISPWGETGAKAYDNNTNTIYSSQSFKPKDGVIDTLGAGDTFLAATLFALWILGYDLNASIELGCKVAGAKCGHYGFKHLHDFQKHI